MKKLILLAALALAGCATAPSANQVFLIQQACMQDAIIRPIVTGLLVLASPVEAEAVKVAEANIDVVCANPTAAPDANAKAAFNAGIAQIMSIEGALLAKQVAK